MEVSWDTSLQSDIWCFACLNQQQHSEIIPNSSVLKFKVHMIIFRSSSNHNRGFNIFFVLKVIRSKLESSQTDWPFMTFTNFTSLGWKFHDGFFQPWRLPEVTKVYPNPENGPWCLEDVWILLFHSPWNWVILLMAEILHHLIGSFPHYLQGFIHPRWCRISSINGMLVFGGAYNLRCLYRGGHSSLVTSCQVTGSELLSPLFSEKTSWPMRSGRCVCFWYCLLEDRKKSKGAETRATNINVDIKPYQTISSNDVMYSTTCVFYVTLQISIPHITSIYMSSWWLFCCSFGNFGLGRVRIALGRWRGWFCSFWPFLCHAGRDHCLQVWRAGLTTLPTFTDRFALRFGSFVWFWCWSLVDFFQVRTCCLTIFDHRSGHINLIWTWMPRSWILKVPQLSPEINGMTGPQRQSEKRSPKDGKGKKTSVARFNYQFLQD